MHTTVEIDRAGRLVVPKRLRDALHLVPGTRLRIVQQGDGILLEHEPRLLGLVRVDGTLVYDPGDVPPMEDRNWVREMRDARDDEIADRCMKP